MSRHWGQGYVGGVSEVCRTRGLWGSPPFNEDVAGFKHPPEFRKLPKLELRDPPATDEPVFRQASLSAFLLEVLD